MTAEFLFFAEVSQGERSGNHAGFHFLNGYYSSMRFNGSYSNYYRTFTATSLNSNQYQNAPANLNLGVFGFKSAAEARQARVTVGYSGSGTQCIVHLTGSEVTIGDGTHDLLKTNRYGLNFWNSPEETSGDFTRPRGNLYRLFKNTCNGTYTFNVTFKTHRIALKLILRLP